MPVLTSLQSTTQVTLPASGAKLDLRDSLTVGQVEALQGEGDQLINSLVVFIADWDFTDDKGEKMPVTKENVALIPIEDLEAIANHMNVVVEKFTMAQKKGLAS